MFTKIIKFKQNNFSFYVIYLYNTQPELIYNAIKKKIQYSPIFFKKMSVIVNIFYIKNEINWEKVYNAIISTGINIIGVSGCNNKNIIKIINNTGIPVLFANNKDNKKISNIDINEKKKNNNKDNVIPKSIIKIIKEKKTLSFNKDIYYKKSKIIYNPIRSGQQIYAYNSDLVIINNVSTGAELIADGNIHIYGFMRGKALSGANGDKSCQIFCNQLFAELLSIAGEYLLQDQIPKKFLGKSSRIYLKNKILTIKSYN
ncbi:septum site-determining protein MinC [Enterobacteriaceae endosymbiont of Donacia cincticornis]|uniref:septum site-determining protein MinC n=1 Tax=Enterobacteriaceae endosymbiont of Donacia cincticornis TaxID=2675773 RepID=UPI00144930C9|nr:septum site-determining protein MinC [Enterobacteriaceae endosymbiont of Donacia cincticornis]QJC36010.1 septum site-determining protein MinC [Enterobacteriaceae endosymbiont of Donacia cincticornis]